jgi:uncharacterized protein
MGRTSIALALAVMAATTPEGAAQQASFDCSQASVPIEYLICSDPQLLGLDGAVGEAFAQTRNTSNKQQRSTALAEQKKWLAARLSRCNVPATGASVSAEVRWQAAPCLDAMYRERLVELGQPAEAVPSIPPAQSGPNFIHPNCLWPLIEQDSEENDETPPIPLGACARGNRHIPVNDDAELGISAQGAADGYLTWLSYKILGVLPDGREPAIVRYNSGGSGNFSELYLLRRTQSSDGGETILTGELIDAGGDRCNGGIARAKLIDARTLEVDYNVTPLDLLSEADEAVAEEHMDDVASCAICCMGTVRNHIDIASMAETSLSVTIDQLVNEDTGRVAANDPQACLDGIIGKAAGKLPHTFPIAELKPLAQAFVKVCAKK